MSNPVKYIKDLEAAGFKRHQAEAQVQAMLDVVEGDLMTKSDFAVFQERLDNKFTQIDSRFARIDSQFVLVDNKLTQFQQQFQQQLLSSIKESEFRTTTRLGFLMVSTTSIAVAVLTWLIKL